MNFKSTWNYSLLFENDNDPKMQEKRILIESKTKAFVEKWKNDDSYLKEPMKLVDALKDYEDWMAKCVFGGDELYYWYLKTHEDENNTVYKARYSQVEEFGKNLLNQVQFFTLKIAKIPFEEQKNFLEFDGLKKYKHLLEKSFESAKHVLSEGEEKIMLLKSTVAHENWEKLTQSFLSKEEREGLNEDGKLETMTFSQFISLCESAKKDVRDDASEKANEILEKISDIAEQEINSILANKKVDDEIRNYARPDAERHMSDDIETYVVDAAVKTISSRFSLANRFYALKAKLMGQEKMTYFERNVPYGNVTKEYEFETATDLVYKVFADLDPRFAEIFKVFVTEGHMDIFPRKGKGSGAWCQYILPSQPTYILLNHNNKLNDVLTLAHESGHGINGELMKDKQDALNYGTPMSTAEVASTFMEDFVLQEILKTVEGEEKLAILLQKLGDDMGTIFRQISFYNFETELHAEFREKGYLSKEEIGKIFIKNISAYLGDSVTFPKGSENWWIYVIHFRSFFYVYSYATGILISKSMQNSVKQDPKFVEKVKEFLSAGLSDSPKNIFAKMGIDITDNNFWERGLDEVEKLLDETEKLALLYSTAYKS
jgi:oligoendopeptidase F